MSNTRVAHQVERNTTAVLHLAGSTAALCAGDAVNLMLRRQTQRDAAEEVPGAGGHGGGAGAPDASRAATAAIRRARVSGSTSGAVAVRRGGSRRGVGVGAVASSLLRA